MDAIAGLRVLYLVGMLLMTFDLTTCGQSQQGGGVWFSLNGTTYQNNSIVTLEDIGEGDDALLCITNRTACCRSQGTGEMGRVLGNWFFPNGARAPSAHAKRDIYRTRGQMVVRMHRRRGGEDGIYHCEIPDAINVTQTIYIGVYSGSTGSPDITNLTYNNQTRTLTCTSTGGPATTVTWRRDGVVITLGSTYQQTKRLVDPVNGTYQTVLTIDDLSGIVSDIVSTYNCTVENDKGESSETVVVPGATTTASITVSSSMRPTTTFPCDRATTQVSSNTRPITTPLSGSTTPQVSSSMRPATTPLSDSATTQVSSSTSPNNIFPSDSATIQVSSSTSPNNTFSSDSATTQVSSSTSPTNTSPSDRTTTQVSNNTRPTTTLLNDSATPQLSSSIRPTTTPLSDSGNPQVSSSTKPTTTSPSDRTTPQASSTRPTTTPTSGDRVTTIHAIIVVAVVIIILVFVILGFVILVVLFKRRKQKLEINKLQNVKVEKEYIKLKKVTTEKKVSSEGYLNENNTLTGEYSEKVIPADSEYTLPASPSRLANHPNLMSGEMESNPMYQDIDKDHDPPSTPNVPQGTASDDLYTMPDITSSQTVEIDNEAVYSEPIQPSLFTGVVGSPSDSEDLLPYAPIYTIPTSLPKSEKEILKVTGGNIQEIRELGTGLFGKVILAETVGLSPKDLKMSESDDDMSKSTLVAVKKLKSGAPSTTKEAFEKEVSFMSRLNDKNVIRILGVCYEDTPFIMMEYMEKGDLNHYLQKFKVLSTTASEPQGQITTSTLVHITKQIASAMKYLASHNYVHRDLATRNCLVGPNYLVKIADFGMSKNLYESHYYRIHGRFVLPVRWMSFECFYGKFSQKSDVWAFGVTTWEIFTLAKEQPYNDMSDKQVVDDAIKGKNRKLLARPDMCPPEVYEIMLKCWEHNTKQRATFDELYQMVSSICSDQQ